MTETAMSPAGVERAPDSATLLAIYTSMRRITSLEAQIKRALGSGQLATAYYPVRGMEAVCACLGTVLVPGDTLVSTYRCVGDVVAKGVPIREIVAEMSGRVGGISKGKGGTMHMSDPPRGLMATTGVVGGGLPIAAGLGLAAKLDGKGHVAAVTFGDGATSIGAFHESLHLASLWDLPVVFVCQNNQWGEHTALREYTKVPDLAARAAAYGVTSVTVDGFDTLATYDALRAAVEEARAGRGPIFVECQTYRLGPHAFGNDESYMPAEEKQAAMDREALPGFRDELLARGVAKAEELDAIDRTIAAEIDEGFEYAAASEPTPDDELLRDVYANDAEVIRR